MLFIFQCVSDHFLYKDHKWIIMERDTFGELEGLLEIITGLLFLFISSTSNGSYSPKKTMVPTHQRKQKPILVCGSSRSAETCLFL